MWDAIRDFIGAVVSFFYGLVPNLGVAIILLTVAVGLVLFPLTLKQVRSMRGMQLLQPELKRLQKEYAGDKPALQQATLALYKERGINPAAGCLPMLLQMPIWFALYQVLQSFAANPAVLNDNCPAQGRQVEPGSAFVCSYQGYVPPDGEIEWNTVTATLTRASAGEAVLRSDSAGVGQGAVLPAVWLTVRPEAGVVPTGGNQVPFSLEVVNGGAEVATLVGLNSDMFGDLLAPINEAVTGNTCAGAGAAIPAGGSLSCSFQGQVPGGTSTSRSTNTVTAVLRDGAGREASRGDRALVDVGEAVPGVVVVVHPESGVAPAGGGMVTFSVQVVNGGAEAITVTGLENDVFRNLMSPAGVPTRFLTMVPNGRLHNDMQSWLEAGSQPADPAWNDFLWMNLSMSPSRALGERGFVAFIPYLFTLLLVMGTAFYQQKQTTPKAKDGQPTPQQPGQAVLKIFPIFFGFISYGLPAGLGVYFAASSLFRIAQQDLIIRLGEREHDEKAKSEPVAELVEPEPKTPQRPVRASGAQPKGVSPAATTRSPQASQQRGKKRRRR
jgi:YidC/Oxa1 family membrane protein insertase